MIPKISIITPSFNQAPFIEQTIDSVLSQGYPNLEYIIIDGGSSDGSVEIIKKHTKHLSYWVSEPDSGQSHAINKGIVRSTGDVVNWLNSDDYYEKGCFSVIAEAFADPEVQVLCARSRKFTATSSSYSSGTDVYFNNLVKTIGWARIDQPETFFRKSAWDEIGLLNESFHYLMDREWWVRYLLKFGLFGVKKVDNVVVNFRLHENSKTVSKSSLFQADHDGIFFTLANHFGLTNISDTIKKSFSLSNVQVSRFPLVNQELLSQIFSYYFLHRAHEVYYRADHRSCRDLLLHVEHDLMPNEDRALYRSLNLKSNRFLSPIVKSIQKWSHN